MSCDEQCPQSRSTCTGNLFRCGIGMALLVMTTVSWGQDADVDAVETRTATWLDPLIVQADKPTAADIVVEGYTVLAGTSATKTYTPRIQLPQIVDVVTPQQNRDQGAETVNQALRYTPGVYTGLAGASSRQTTVALRGFPGGDVNNTFLDGLRLQNDPGAYANILIDPFFLKRLDVIKGPASMLYGYAQPGGLVNFVTKKPLDHSRAEISLNTGSFDAYGLDFDLTNPLPDQDIGSYRMVGSFENSDTQYNVVERERYTLMPSLRLNLSEHTRLLLQAYLQREPEGGFHGSVPYGLSVDGSRLGKTVGADWVDTSSNHEKFERKTHLLSYDLTHEVNDHVQLRSKARYANLDVEMQQVYQNGFIGNGAELVRYYVAGTENLEAFSMDNNALIRFETGPFEHRILVGLSYQTRQNDVRYSSGSAAPLDPFDPDYGNAGVSGVIRGPAQQRKLSQFGLYLQEQMIWDRWHFVFGGRHDHIKRSYETRPGSQRVERSDNAFSARAAVLYESQWGLSPYLSYSEGFSPSTYAPVGRQISSPTQSHQYEAGLKYQPPGMNAMFTLALYDLTQENVQQRTQVTPLTFQNVGDVESRGIELSARAELTERLHMIAGYTRNNVEYQSNISQGGLSIEAGNTYVRIPEEQASLWLAYDLPYGVRLGAGMRYVGESYANASNTLTVPSYTMADASATFDMGTILDSLEGASLRINVNNIFDKKHVAACFSEVNCYYGAPRTITATLDYQF